MEAPTDIDKCLAILVLRTADCSQNMAASIMHCAKLRIGQVERWFSKELSYSEAVRLCNDMAIKRVIDIGLIPQEEVDKKLLEKLAQIIGDDILRHYRQDYLFRLRWVEDMDLAVRLKRSISNINAKDWAIWGLPDTGELPLTSEAELKIWVDRGKLMIKLGVEKDPRFSPFLSRLKNAFPAFVEYDKWKNSLRDFIDMCWTVAHEIWSQAENKTGLNLTPIPAMGKGHLLNVPKFIYEFSLDNYASGNRPDLEVLQNDPSRHKLVPKDLSEYILAIGSKDEMIRCEQVVVTLASKYTGDERIGKIKASAVQMRKQAELFLVALSTVLKEATVDSETPAQGP